jgi:hypothetical protein
MVSIQLVPPVQHLVGWRWAFVMLALGPAVGIAASRRLTQLRTGALKGTITKSSYVGTHMEYTIDTAAGALFATCARVERPLAPGDAVALVFAARGVIVVAGT